MTHVTCRLTAKNRDQLRNPTIGNRVGLWAAFTFYSDDGHAQRYDLYFVLVRLYKPGRLVLKKRAF